MKKYMVVYKTDCNETGACFYDRYSAARDAMMDMECGLGWYRELYMRVRMDANGKVVLDEEGWPIADENGEYIFMEA